MTYSLYVIVGFSVAVPLCAAALAWAVDRALSWYCKTMLD